MGAVVKVKVSWPPRTSPAASATLPLQGPRWHGVGKGPSPSEALVGALGELPRGAGEPTLWMG